MSFSIAVQRAEALDEMIVEFISRAPTEDAERFLEFRDAINDNPETRAEAIDEIEGLLERVEN